VDGSATFIAQEEEVINFVNRDRLGFIGDVAEVGGEADLATTSDAIGVEEANGFKLADDQENFGSVEGDASEGGSKGVGNRGHALCTIDEVE